MNFNTSKAWIMVGAVFCGVASLESANAGPLRDYFSAQDNLRENFAEACVAAQNAVVEHGYRTEDLAEELRGIDRRLRRRIVGYTDEFGERGVSEELARVQSVITACALDRVVTPDARYEGFGNQRGE